MFIFTNTINLQRKIVLVQSDFFVNHFDAIMRSENLILLKWFVKVLNRGHACTFNSNFLMALNYPATKIRYKSTVRHQKKIRLTS